MNYNLESTINYDIVENGVYESLQAPKKGMGITIYLHKVMDEIENCPYIHCPDYDLLVPIYQELKVTEGNRIYPIRDAIRQICFLWWIDKQDENRL